MSDLDGQLEALKGAKLMIVDDEPTTVDVLEMVLEGEGYSNFVGTSDSREALDLLRSERPDVLLLDLMMPGVDGLEILEAMRQDDQLQYIPVLILTSATDAETKLKALELGATDFLGKPVDPSELALRIRNTLAAKAYQDRLTYYDGLTGLPNRRLFLERLERAVSRARASSTECAIIQINLDRFKQINDTLGHGVGDALLKSVAERLEKSIRPGDLLGHPVEPREGSPLARVGGDEFSLFLPGVGPVERAARVARRVLSSLAEPFWMDGRDLFLTATLGISLFPADGDSVDALLANARVAVSHAKRGGGNDYEFFSNSLNSNSVERLTLETGLRKALDHDELVLYYQPKNDVRSGRVVGAEALMRWRHPDLGLVSPVQFIPIAEESGLIAGIGSWALDRACLQNKSWQDAGHPPMRVSVNVSSRQFRSERFLQSIANALGNSRLDPKYLVLELTESTIMENPLSSGEMLSGLQSLGVQISVDDFGTGYSSLASLKSFSMDELKIDRSFVKGIPHDSDDAAIVTAIIGMAHSLGLKVVAEGVETEQQLAFLRERGCDEYQGFLCSRPVSPDEWPALFERTNADPS